MIIGSWRPCGTRDSGPRAVVVSIFALCLVGLTGACGQPSRDDVGKWKTAPDGSAKLGAAIKNPKADLDVRAEAAAALVATGQGEEMEAAIAGLDIDERGKLIPAVVAKIAPLARGTGAEASKGDVAGDARDALYALRGQATTADARKPIDEALFPLLVEDVKAGRERVGRSSLLQMLIGLGPTAVPLVLPLLEDPAVPFAIPVEVVDKVGDRATKEKGGDALVVRAGKASSLPEEYWSALATLAGKKAAEFLIATVERNQPPDVDRAAVAMEKMPSWAPGLTGYAVGKAGNALTPAALREQMFRVAERDRGEEGRKTLIALIGSTLDPAIRTRTFRALIKTGGEGILPGLEAWPKSARITTEQLKDEIVAPLSSMPGMETRGPLFKAMDSKAPLARLVAILVLEKMGFKSDAEPIEKKLGKDKGSVAGLSPGERIDRQAARAAAALRKSGY